MSEIKIPKLPKHHAVKRQHNAKTRLQTNRSLLTRCYAIPGFNMIFHTGVCIGIHKRNTVGSANDHEL